MGCVKNMNSCYPQNLPDVNAQQGLRLKGGSGGRRRVCKYDLYEDPLTPQMHRYRKGDEDFINTDFEEDRLVPTVQIIPPMYSQSDLALRVFGSRPIKIELLSPGKGSPTGFTPKKKHFSPTQLTPKALFDNDDDYDFDAGSTAYQSAQFEGSYKQMQSLSPPPVLSHPRGQTRGINGPPSMVRHSKEVTKMKSKPRLTGSTIQQTAQQFQESCHPIRSPTPPLPPPRGKTRGIKPDKPYAPYAQVNPSVKKQQQVAPAQAMQKKEKGGLRRQLGKKAAALKRRVTGFCKND